MPNVLLILVMFKEKAIAKFRENYLYYARINKKVTMLKLICVYTYRRRPKFMSLIRQPVWTVPIEMPLHNFLNEIQIAAQILR